MGNIKYIYVKKTQRLTLSSCKYYGSSYGNRTRVSGVRGQRPGPLDE